MMRNWPQRVIFDNGKVTVKDGCGAHTQKQTEYAAGSGNEKGLVEGLAGYSRRNNMR